MEIKVYEPNPDVREINFRIVEVCLDMYVLGVHYHRETENEEWVRVSGEITVLDEHGRRKQDSL